jgi:dTDP-4-dehydrorhamnose reductase
VRLLVTGADGQVGWELRRSLLPLGEVIALDRQGCDLSYPQTLPRIIGDIGPDVIVNAAAYTAVEKAEEAEALATTINGTAVGRIAEVAHGRGCLLIHYSTDYVFDGTKDGPYSEVDRPHPLNAYGRSKLAGERAIEECGGDYLILRTSWVYAARGRNFLRTILRLARERDELRVVVDQVGAPTWAHEIADATASIARQACRERETGGFISGLLHVTASGSSSWFDFAQAILEQARLPAGAKRPSIHPISSAEYPGQARRPKNSLLECDRVRRRFGIALSDWKQALTQCMQDMTLHEES